ncbi:choice-of-anchor B family protein [Gemmatimonas aurantiaca]|nr:choice-of-anchor B family protein [Gemmatimonas aurantiaca]
MVTKMLHYGKRRDACLITILTLVICSSLWLQLYAIPLDFRANLASASEQNTNDEDVANDGMTSVDQVLTLKYPGDSTYQLYSVRTKKVGNGGSDCWGWRAPDGIRWAIMGTRDKIIFQEVAGTRSYSIPAPSESPCGGGTFWKDMATYQGFCYSVSECAGENAGIIIIDMNFLPDSVSLVNVIPISPSDTSTYDNRSHNLAIDTITGTLFVEGDGTISAHVYSLANPADPRYSGGLLGGIIHDLHVVNDTAYLATGRGRSFSIWVRHHSAFPFVYVTTVDIPNSGYVHNVWTNHDRTLLATAEESQDKTVKLWDISDFTNIQLLGEYLGPNALAHNVHIQGDRMYIAHYNAGVRVVDISDPTNPTEIGFFNTSTTPDISGFESCWGVWPHAGDGWIYASTKDGFLHQLRDTIVLLNDSIWIEDGQGLPNESICLNVYLRNSVTVRSITLPFSWDGELDLIFDSIATAGTRTDLFELVQLTSIDEINKTGSVTFVASLSSSVDGLIPGEGAILKLCFTFPEILTTKQAALSFGSSPINHVNLSTTLDFTIIPDTSSGTISQCVFGGPDSDGDGVSDSCDVCPEYDDLLDEDGDGLPDGCDECPTIVGVCPCCDVPGDINDDGATTIGDVIFLISHIFNADVSPTCNDKADANGDGAITIGDVTTLITYIFGGGPAPVCP